MNFVVKTRNCISKRGVVYLKRGEVCIKNDGFCSISMANCTWAAAVAISVVDSSCEEEVAGAALTGGFSAHSSDAALALSGCMCGAPTVENMRAYCPIEVQMCEDDATHLCATEIAAFAACATFEVSHEFSSAARGVHNCLTAALHAPRCTAADNCVGCTAALRPTDYFSTEGSKIYNNNPGVCSSDLDTSGHTTASAGAGCVPIGGVCRMGNYDHLPWWIDLDDLKTELCFADLDGCASCADAYSNGTMLDYQSADPYSFAPECLAAVSCSRPDGPCFDDVFGAFAAGTFQYQSWPGRLTCSGALNDPGAPMYNNCDWDTAQANPAQPDVEGLIRDHCPLACGDCVTGVDFSSVAENLRASDFSVADISCAIGYGGTLSTAVCELTPERIEYGSCEKTTAAGAVYQVGALVSQLECMASGFPGETPVFTMVAEAAGVAGGDYSVSGCLSAGAALSALRDADRSTLCEDHNATSCALADGCAYSDPAVCSAGCAGTLIGWGSSNGPSPIPRVPADALLTGQDMSPTGWEMQLQDGQGSNGTTIIGRAHLGACHYDSEWYCEVTWIELDVLDPTSFLHYTLSRPGGTGCRGVIDPLAYKWSASSPGHTPPLMHGADPCATVGGVDGVTCLADDDAAVNAHFGEHGLSPHWDDVNEDAVDYGCNSWPCAAPLLGAVGTMEKSQLSDGDSIYGAFEAGFGAHEEGTILKELGCPLGLGHVQGGIDTRTAEKMIAHECGVELPRWEGGRYISLLDECGGHTRAGHSHSEPGRLICEDATRNVTLGGVLKHSELVGTINDGRPLGAPLYGKYTWNGDLPVLDACGGMFGPTPDSYGEPIYHYHTTDDAPFSVGCFGPSYGPAGADAQRVVTMEECRALYDGCGDSDLIEVRFGPESHDTLLYDPWCPCFDPETGSNAHNPSTVFCDAEAVCPAATPLPTFTIISGPCSTSEQGTCVQSPNYPSDYGANEGCEISASAAGSLRTEAFSTEAEYDKITIGAETYSGTTGPAGLLPDAASMQWSADGSVQSSGWKICVDAPDFSPGLTHDCFEVVSSVPRIPASVDRACDQCQPPPTNREEICGVCVEALGAALQACARTPALVAATMTRSFAVTRQDAEQHIRTCYDAKEAGGCALPAVQKMCPVSCNAQLPNIESIGGACVCDVPLVVGPDAEQPLCLQKAADYAALGFSFCEDPLKSGSTKTGCAAVASAGCVWQPAAVPPVVSQVSLNAAAACDWLLGSCESQPLCSIKHAGHYVETGTVAAGSVSTCKPRGNADGCASRAARGLGMSDTCEAATEHSSTCTAAPGDYAPSHIAACLAGQHLLDAIGCTGVVSISQFQNSTVTPHPTQSGTSIIYDEAVSGEADGTANVGVETLPLSQGTNTILGTLESPSINDYYRVLAPSGTTITAIRLTVEGDGSNGVTSAYLRFYDASDPSQVAGQTGGGLVAAVPANEVSMLIAPSSFSPSASGFAGWAHGQSEFLFMLGSGGSSGMSNNAYRIVIDCVVLRTEPAGCVYTPAYTTTDCTYAPDTVTVVGAKSTEDDYYVGWDLTATGGVAGNIHVGLVESFDAESGAMVISWEDGLGPAWGTGDPIGVAQTVGRYPGSCGVGLGAISASCVAVCAAANRTMDDGTACMTAMKPAIGVSAGRDDGMGQLVGPFAGVHTLTGGTTLRANPNWAASPPIDAGYAVGDVVNIVNWPQDDLMPAGVSCGITGTYTIETIAADLMSVTFMESFPFVVPIPANGTVESTDHCGLIRPAALANCIYTPGSLKPWSDLTWELSSKAMCSTIDGDPIGGDTTQRPFFAVSALCSQIPTLESFEAGVWGTVSCNCGNTQTQASGGKNGWCPARSGKTSHDGDDKSVFVRAEFKECVDERDDCPAMVHRWGELACAKDTPCPVSCGTCPVATCTGNHDATNDFDCSMVRCTGMPNNSSLKCGFSLFRLLRGELRAQDCPVGCTFIPRSTSRPMAHTIASSASDMTQQRHDSCCAPDCTARQGNEGSPATPEIHMFNWFTPATGVAWSVEAVSPGCAETQGVELGRCRGLTPDTIMDNVCMGLGLFEDSKWNAGMQGCYVSEQECQHMSAALGSSRTVITPAEGSHGVGCSFQASELSLRAEFSMLTLEQLRVRATFAGVDTGAIPPRTIAASMANRTGEAIIDLLVKKLSSGCSPPKCAVPAGTITEIRSTYSNAGQPNGTIFPEGVWTKWHDPQSGGLDERGSFWLFNTAECGPSGCASFIFSIEGFRDVNLGGDRDSDSGSGSAGSSSCSSDAECDHAGCRPVGVLRYGCGGDSQCFYDMRDIACDGLAHGEGSCFGDHGMSPITNGGRRTICAPRLAPACAADHTGPCDHPADCCSGYCNSASRICDSATGRRRAQGGDAAACPDDGTAETLTVGSDVYRLLEGTAYDVDRSGADGSCQQGSLCVPTGWSIAPRTDDVINNVIATHEWGVSTKATPHHSLASRDNVERLLVISRTACVLRTAAAFTPPARAPTQAMRIAARATLSTAQTAP